MIEIKNLSKYYSETGVLSLDDISLDIPEKSIVGLIGVNGAGKSTLLRIAAGIYRQDKGTVLIDGEPVYENNSVKNKLAYVSDEQFFRHGMTMKKMASICSTLREGFSLKKFCALAEQFGLDINGSLAGFSKGMRRQSEIITALSYDAKYMLCDETFDGMDPIAREKAKKIFFENVVDSGTTILMSSHNLQELEGICDRIVLLDKGKLVLSAELDDLKGAVSKYQLVMEGEFDTELLKPIQPYAVSQSGRVTSFIAAGDSAEVEGKLKNIAAENKCDIVYFEALALSLEEIFEYKLKNTESLPKEEEETLQKGLL